ncbi:hypothetical protein EYF80_015299 [Liparis tanakae]|uniref:Uncharacterized protein n=1 Tax=Liparis tanakae TaxID=230148 RepID=A0A4Z2I8W8_9TELE|nr:hypothetical protein EYF80_015299 [Liparis tanakae]
MGLRARLTCTVRVACRKVSATLARSMLLLLHCSRASNHVRFLSSSRMVWLLTEKLSVGMWGSSSLSEKSKPCDRQSIVSCKEYSPCWWIFLAAVELSGVASRLSLVLQKSVASSKPDPKILRLHADLLPEQATDEGLLKPGNNGRI